MKKISLVLFLAAGLVLSGSVKAEAAFISYICNDEACAGGDGDLIVTDGGAGDTFVGTAGAILAGGSVGGLLVSATSVSKPLVGGAANPIMDISFSAVGTGEVWIYAVDTGFTYLGGLNGIMDGNWSGSGNSIEYAICEQASDAAPFTFEPGNCGFAGSLVSPFGPGLSYQAAGSPYALLLGIHITRGSSGITSGDFLVVPEPATLAMLGLGLVGLGAASRRRRAARAR